jgi:hypothetical protein
LIFHWLNIHQLLPMINGHQRFNESMPKAIGAIGLVVFSFLKFNRCTRCNQEKHSFTLSTTYKFPYLLKLSNKINLIIK